MKNQHNSLFQLEDSGFTEEEDEDYYYDDDTEIVKSHVSGFSHGELNEHNNESDPTFDILFPICVVNKCMYTKNSKHCKIDF